MKYNEIYIHLYTFNIYAKNKINNINRCIYIIYMMQKIYIEINLFKIF